ncbi:GNAT family N-acetyltransferase [Saccharopolyspora elongata]|uniref:GNAT family N-acetyltransferase n=1 Tax=Saccharopolyspora elongata TaxID=2530387 RepID=A0A4R4Z689_9PSEU|nr:GNAT family N-acetyltransferase [Saccharopolyspora elongata]
MVGSVRFDPLSRQDFGLLQSWLSAPHVREWWRGAEPTADLVEQEYGPSVDGVDPARCFVINVAGERVGMVQCYRMADEPEWDALVGIPAAAGVDYLIGMPGRCGLGIGPSAIAAFTELVFGLYDDVESIVAVPQADNQASRRALERAGFELVEERDLESDDPSDAGVSAIYEFRR